jgi:two-component system CheB/CheR fusion protein
MASSTDSSDLESLIRYIRTSRGFDFAGYKRPSLQRRFEKRMQTVRAGSFDEYHSFLERHPEEFAELFNTILINVTAFFRDAPAWDYLRGEIVPRIIEESQIGSSIRIWSTGCASGEEAYSLAICFAEVLSEAEFGARIKIYATDIDEEALTEGRHGIYTAAKVETMPNDLRERYFERIDERYIVSAVLRRAVIFGRHDVVQDPPISRINLLACRNTLMYLTPDAQGRILANFHFALRESGYLFLGKSEMMLGRSPLFAPVDLKRRVFEKLARADAYRPAMQLRRQLDPHTSDALMRDAGFETAPVAQLVVDHEGNLMLANMQARTLFNLAQGDVGSPLKDLDVSYRPVELRSQIEKAQTERHAVILRDIEWAHENGERRIMDIQIAPLLSGDGSYVGVGIAFSDMTKYSLLQETVERARREAETAYEELQSTVEELETTNEELQSTNEELETTNEELQSTNEELETMNEELHSTNEELETINDELNQRTDELNHSNFFLESVLGSLDAGVVVLNEDLRVSAWNDGAYELWGLRADEVQGQLFIHLDIGLPVEQLQSALRTVLAGEDSQSLLVDATNRRGRTISCRVRISALTATRAEPPPGLIIFMEPEAT